MISAKTMLSIAAAVGLLTLSPVLAGAQKATPPGAAGAGATPGHEMQRQGSKPGEPGASGYAPGREGANDRDDRRERSTTGAGGARDRDRDDRIRGDRDRDDRAPGGRDLK
jgi:hypothetical protein